MKNLLFPTCPCLVMWLFTVAAPCSGQGTAPPAGADDASSPQQKESQRIRKIMDWAKQAQPTQKELMLKLYEPVLDGCKHDYPRNQQFAELCQGRADDAAKNSQEKTAEKWAKATRLFLALAQQDSIILKALPAGDGTALDAAFAEIPRLERQILEVTEHPVRRNWNLPGELSGGSVRKPVPATAPASTAPAPVPPPATPTK